VEKANPLIGGILIMFVTLGITLGIPSVSLGGQNSSPPNESQEKQENFGNDPQNSQAEPVENPNKEGGSEELELLEQLEILETLEMLQEMELYNNLDKLLTEPPRRKMIKNAGGLSMKYAS